MAEIAGRRAAVLFASSRLYNNLADFRHIGQALPPGLEPVYLYLPDDDAYGQPEPGLPEGVTTLDLGATFNDNRFGTAGAAAVLSRKLANFTSKRQNFRAILGFLSRRPPALVVVSSDLGSINICFLIESCRLLSIPVLVLYTFDVAPERAPAVLDPLVDLLDKSRSASLRFLRAYLYYRFARRETPGTFDTNARVCVLTRRAEQAITARGVAAQRVRIIRPVDESLPAAEELKRLRGQLGLAEGDKVIAFFTECIHEVYGSDYAERCTREAAQALREACARTKATVVVKFHPREPDEMRKAARRAFSWDGTVMLEDPGADAEALLGLADLSIAHFSRVLIRAALAGRPFLSLNFNGDRKRTFIPSGESAALEAADGAALAGRVERFLRDTSEKERVAAAGVRVAESFRTSPDTALAMIKEMLHP